MLQPKKFKFKKTKKRYLRQQFLETKTYKLVFGTMGLKAIEKGKLSAKKIEMLRQILNRYLARKGKIWIKIFPSIPVTAKPSEVRMGKGKGNVDFWCSPVKAGTILFEIQGVTQQKGIFALLKVQKKIFFKTKIIKIC
jgi:large subunit ribosomal protein L16